MNEYLEETQKTVDEIKELIASLPPRDQMVVAWVAADIQALVSRHGENGLLALTLVGAELQLQAAEQEWAEHERNQLAEQEAHGT